MSEEKKIVEIEIDYKNVFKSPLRWFGLVYPYFIAIIILIGIFWVWNLSTITENSIPPTLKKSWPTELIQKKGSIQEGVNVAAISTPTPEMVAAGKKLFKANCASCHGNEGKGNGPAGELLNPKPRNFTSSKGWKNGRKISQMYKTLQEGIIENGMAAYEYLPVKDKFALIHYIRTFAPDFPIDTKEDLEELDFKYSLSKGKVSPSQISIAKAIKIMAKESESHIEEVNNIINKIDNDKGSDGYNLFESHTNNCRRFIRTLINDQNWKTSQSAFIRMIISNTPVNGAKPDIINLTSDDWAALHNYLLDIFA